MGHFSSRSSFEMMNRQKCKFFLDPLTENFEKITANPSVSRNGPIWQLIEAQNYPNRGEYLALKTRPKMLQKWDILGRD